MTDETLELTLQVFNNGVRRYAHINADTPNGRWCVNGRWLNMNARSAYEAVEMALRIMLVHPIRTGPGRKPKDYWKRFFLCFADPSRRPTVRPLSRTSAGIPIAPTKKEMVEQIRSIVANGFHRDTAVAALEEVLDTLRRDKEVDRMNGFPVQGSVPS